MFTRDAFVAHFDVFRAIQYESLLLEDLSNERKRKKSNGHKLTPANVQWVEEWVEEEEEDEEEEEKCHK